MLPGVSSGEEGVIEAEAAILSRQNNIPLNTGASVTIAAPAGANLAIVSCSFTAGLALSGSAAIVLGGTFGQREASGEDNPDANSKLMRLVSGGALGANLIIINTLGGDIICDLVFL